jgi:peptide/nickel transport system substrate-binding protein
LGDFVRHVLGSRKRSAGIVAILLVTVMTLAACGSSGSGKSNGNKNSTPTTAALSGTKPTNLGKPTPGGSLTYALPAESNGGWCLPEAQLAASGIVVARSIYDYLAVPNDKNEYVPDLADSITSNADFTSWKIHVRAGIKFQDGSPLDAQVVADNLNAYRGKLPTRSPLLFVFVFQNIKNISVTDPMTVTVDMLKPWASFPASLYSYGRLGIMAEKQLKDGKNCFKDMVGTGPFSFKGDWVQNDHLTVVRNPNYWRKDSYGQQLPYLDKVTFVPVVQTSTLVNGLQASPPQFDLALTDDNTAISQLQPVVNAGNLDILKSGQNPEVAYTLFNDSKPPFNNILARQAFAYAVDREQYNKLANKGLLEIASGPFGPGTLGYVADTGLPNYDPAKAADLVKQYTAETHQPLAFTYQTGSDPIAQQDAEILQKYAKAAGMNMTIKQVDEATLINYAIAGTFQASAWRNHPGFDPDTQWVWWHCDVAPADVAGTTHAGTDDATHKTGNNCNNLVNFSKFNDAVINADFEKARSSNDPAVRKAAYEDINREFAKQVWEGWGYWSLWTMPSQKNVEGLLGPSLPTATNPDATAAGDKPFTGLASAEDLSGLWLKK